MSQPNAADRSERVGGYIKNKVRLSFKDRERTPTQNERRETAWKLVKAGIGSQDDLARATGFTVSAIANYRRLWKIIVRNHRHEVAHAMSAKQAYEYARKSGIGKFR